MGLYDLARKVNAQRKAFLKSQAGRVLSPVRRIEFVHPPKGRRVVAMTFDDGPDALPVEGRGKGLTQIILDELAEYGARATFDVIGDTSGNYPDEKGPLGAFMWSGCAYDHYPKFDADSLGGVKNQPELTRALIAAGHELSNHGSAHRLFGPMRAVYGRRVHCRTLEEVLGDLKDLHDHMEAQFGYTMGLGRPAHYIDNIPDGANAYDAYRVMGYNYVAASFDGAGWQPLPTYEEEVRAMVKPLEDALRTDPESLNGKIIFQKDGCNMMERTPIADALPQQLKLLYDNGYTVVAVSELLAISPFEDLDPASPAVEAARYLLSRGHTVGYKNNTFHGERPITADELQLTLARPDALRIPRHLDAKALAETAKAASPVKFPAATGDLLLDAAMKLGVPADEALFKDKKSIPRRDAIPLLAEMVKVLER